MKKRTNLMIAFHFPPQAGSSGVFRTLNFARHLPKSGWLPSVLTAHARAYEDVRLESLATIPPEIEVLRGFSLDAPRHLGISGKYPGILALPDRWSSWWFGAVLKGLKHIYSKKPDVLWSTYPIATAHLIGATLAWLTGKPWVAEFRDPMTNPGYPSDPSQWRVRRWLEKVVMKRASHCVFVTRRMAEMYLERYPHIAGKYSVIPNGYDGEAFVGVGPQRFGASPDKLLFLHSGIIYPEDRDPSAFFAAIKQLMEEGAIAREKICIRFRAPVHGPEILALAEKFGMTDIVEVAPPVAYKDAIGEMLGADLLLLFQGSSFNVQIPAKVYEYLRTGKPIIALVDPVGDTANLLTEFPSAVVADISDSGQIAGRVGELLLRLSQSEYKALLATDKQSVERFSREKQAVALAELLDGLVSSDGSK